MNSRLFISVLLSFWNLRHVLAILPGCSSNGPYTSQCLDSSWLYVGCVSEGHKHPTKQTSAELDSLNALSVIDLEWHLRDIVAQAVSGNTQAQLNCWGMESYSQDECSSFTSVLSVKCVNFIWVENGCSPMGSSYPSKLSEVDFNNLYRLMDQRDVEESVKSTELNAVGGNKLYQDACFGLELPVNCPAYYSSAFTESCLIDIWVTTVGCKETGTLYPPKLNSTEKQLFLGNNLHSVTEKMQIYRQDQIKCYGLELPFDCEYDPPHNESCLLSAFSKSGCNEVKGKIPTAQISSFEAMKMPELMESLKTVKVNSINVKSGLSFESCNGTGYIDLGNEMLAKFHLKSKSYNDALITCENENALLFYQITDAATQTKLEEKLFNSSIMFDLSSWWIGLDDKLSEGVFLWNNGDELSGYQNWDTGLSASHEGSDCAYLKFDSDWSWDVDDCQTFKPFICLKYTPPDEVYEDFRIPEACSPTCNDNEECVQGVCRCYTTLFEENNCSWSKGHLADRELIFDKRSFLFIKKLASWKQGNQFCKGHGGHLAMPFHKDRHDLLIRNMIDIEMANVGSAGWLGFHDMDSEGTWKFLNDMPVHFSPVFKNMTNNGKIPFYNYNTTSVLETWHFYFEERYRFFNKLQGVQFCENLDGGILPKVVTEDVFKFFTRYYHDHFKRLSDRGVVLQELHKHNYFWLSLEREKTPPGLATSNPRNWPPFLWSDGEESYFSPAWYKNNGIPIPDDYNATEFNGWHDIDPNNADFYIVESVYFGLEERCGCWYADHSGEFFFDWGCYRLGHVLSCQKGPFEFERWHYGGTPYTEPNGALGKEEEDCGAMRLDLSDEGRDFTSIKTEFWNDYNCDLKFPFVCEVDLPENCLTYNPVLTEKCVRGIGETLGCKGFLTDHLIDHLRQQTVGAVKNWFREAVQEDNAKDNLYQEICKRTEYINFDGLEVVYHLNQTTYSKAVEICRKDNAVLPTLKEEAYREKLLGKATKLANITDYWWLGLDDIRIEGLFEWSSGEPLDDHHYSAWNRELTSTVDEKDCVAMNAFNQLKWSERNCEDEYAFICVKATCEYPLNYSRVHRDHCYNFRLDPNSKTNKPSPYARTVKEAALNCEKSFGKLSVIEDETTALFFDNFIPENVDFHHLHKFWVSLFDVLTGGEIDPSLRKWEWNNNGTKFSFSGDFLTFIRDGFEISNFQLYDDKDSLIPFEARCMYGDVLNRTYRLPLNPLSAHHYARSKSCKYGDPAYLQWTWVSTYHLKHVKSGLCLTAPFEMDQESTEVSESPSVRVRPCNISDPYQHWVCQSSNTFHVKLRKFQYSFILDGLEPYDRVFVGGQESDESCSTFWKAKPGGESVCDERYRPAENLFLVKYGGIKYNRNGGCNYQPQSIANRFYDKKEAEIQCLRSGGKPASVSDINAAIKDGFSEGCVCAHVRDDNKLRGYMKNKDRKCALGPGLPKLTKNLFVCHGADSEYQWCYRGKRKDNVVEGLQFARWCATYSFLSSKLKGLEERSCLEQNYFVCDKQMVDCCCPSPHLPTNSLYVREDWRKGGTATRLRCDQGYGFDANPNNLEKNLECTESSRTWNPDPTSLVCQRLGCPDPPSLNNNVKSSNPPGLTSGNYKYNDSVTYTCNPTFTINSLPGIKTKTITCQDDQKWAPDPSKFDCLKVKCKNVPQMPNSKAHYTEATNTLWYSCNTGYWVQRGVTEIHGFTCLDSGEWEPNPYTNVSCQVLSCEEPVAPNRAQTLLTSYRYLANLTILCDIGFALTPSDLNIVCNKEGIWEPTTEGNYCQNRTCDKPLPPGPDVVVGGTLKETYYYNDILSYSCNKTGHELRSAFTMFSLQQSACLGVNNGGEIVMHSTCDKDDLHQLWIWINMYQIQSVFNEKCLKAVGSVVVVGVCDETGDRQTWDCPLDPDNPYLLKIKEMDSYLSVTAANNVELRTGVIDSFMSWTSRDKNQICLYRNGYKEIESTCSKYGLWNIPGNFFKCVVLLCPVLHPIAGAELNIAESKVKYSYGSKASYVCEEGTWLKEGLTSVSIVCNYTGFWEPKIDFVRCSPLMCSTPYAVQYSIQSGLLWTWKSKVQYTCATGYWFGRQDFKRVTTCSTAAIWEPDPETKFKCIFVTCEDPGPIPHASYHISSDEVDYDAIVQYECDDGYWVSRGVMSVGVTCLSTGFYSPPPASLKCARVTCFPPDVVRFAQLFPSNYGPYEAGKNVTFKCIPKYWIKPGIFTSDLACTNYGEWRPLSSSILCIPLLCPAPYLVPNGTIASGGLGAGVRRLITCNTGFWIDQRKSLKTINLVCGETTAIWESQNITCHEATCSDPGELVNAERYINPPSYTYLEQIVYRCKVGFHVVQSNHFIEEFASVCQENGEWQPPLDQTCEIKTCNFTVSHYTHGTSTFVPDSTYNYLDTVQLTCDDGYWILLDKPTHKMTFVCQENSLFTPNPLYIYCTLVECPAPMQRPHAKLTALHITFGSKISYRCTEGYGDHQRPSPQIFWEFDCLKDGNWNGNVESVICVLITCNKPPEVEHAIQVGKSYIYNHKVKYECIRGKWFGKNNYSMEVTCQSNTRWDRKPPDCATVICQDPTEISQHAEIVGDDIVYLSLMTVHCDPGYLISPGKSHQTIRCMEDGEWDQPAENFTCKPIVCPQPTPVFHAEVEEGFYVRDSTALVVCEEGYYISRMTNNVTITCNSNARWNPDPAYIECRDEFSFHCDMPTPVENAFLLAESFRYQSIVNVSCGIGYWLSPLNYSMSIKCMFDGNWFPNPSHITCKKIICEEVTSSSIFFNILSLSTTMHASCDEKEFILIEENEKHTLMKSVTLVCGSNGQWQPHQSSLSCVLAGCDLPTTPPNMNITEPITDLSTDSKITYECEKGFYISPGVTSVTVTCLDDGLWYPDLKTLLCKPVICGLPKLPVSNGIFIGKNISYGAKLEYRCEEGFYIPIFSSRDNILLTSVTLECEFDGTWRDIRTIDSCQKIKCEDPGFKLSTSRSLSFQNFFVGDNVTYTCRDDLWFHQDRKSVTLFCNDQGKWIPSKSLKLQCREIICNFPPHIKNSDIIPMGKKLHKYGETISYNCHKGFSFNEQPENGSYILTCDTDGVWAVLSPLIQCVPTKCPLLPKVKRASVVGNYSLNVGSNATYSCDSGHMYFNFNNATVFCDFLGVWNPEPMSIQCSVQYCPAPLESIPNGFKHGKVYEAGYQVTYVCIEGYRVGGVNMFTGWKFVTVECKDDTTWSIDVATLYCTKISCGDPPLVENTTVLAAHGVHYQDEATYKCKLAHFIDQDNRLDHVRVKCDADGQWLPSVSHIYCKPFRCAKPSHIQNGTLILTSFVYESEAWIQCDKGFVIDHGENGLVSYKKSQQKIVCHHSLQWYPSLQDIKCVSIQCLNPVQPAKAYVKGGTWSTDKTRVFKYQDTAIATCAHGYNIESSGLLSMEATCTEYGNWTQNISAINCVDIKCVDPGFYHHSKRIGKSLRYLSLVTYVCDHGYFIKPGVTSITLQCNYNAEWTPSVKIKCLEVICGQPGSIPNALQHTNNKNYVINSNINYTCDDGYHVAKEQDAVGNWVIGDRTRRVTVICQPNGRWKPRRENIHCSATSNATTLYDLILNGKLLQPGGLIDVREPGLLGRSAGKSLNQFYVELNRYARLILRCNEGQVLVAYHVGQWLNVKSEMVTTKHIPVLLTHSGTECKVFNMFDGQPETYWMPVDRPAPNVHHMSWKGWGVDIDLEMEYIVGSFQIHTSNDYKHAVKTFYVLVSSDRVHWNKLGPFNTIVGTFRYEFFHDFTAVQARFIRLVIQSTALMQSPAVIKFGIYGAPFDCVDEVFYTIDVYGIPVFIGVVFVIFLILGCCAFKNDKINRWKRFLMIIPPKFEIPNCRIYELLIKTEWNNLKTDLLLKISGSKGSSPVIWLRHSFKGLLRPGYSDIIVLGLPSKIGKPLKIDLVAVDLKKGAVQNIRSNASSDIMLDNPPVTLISRSLETIKSSFLNVPLTYRPTHVEYKKQGRAGKGGHFGLREMILRDVAKNVSWKAWLGLRKRGKIATLFSTLFGRNGIGLQHTSPMSFDLQTTSSTSNSISRKTWRFLSFFYNHYGFPCFSSSKPYLHNISYSEKVLYVMMCTFHMFFVTALMRGFYGSNIYFISQESSRFYEFLKSLHHTNVVLVAIITAYTILTIMTFITRFASGKWSREVEDAVSYWQGNHLIWTTCHLVKTAFSSLLGCRYNSDQRIFDDLAVKYSSINPLEHIPPQIVSPKKQVKFGQLEAESNSALSEARVRFRITERSVDNSSVTGFVESDGPMHMDPFHVVERNSHRYDEGMVRFDDVVRARPEFGSRGKPNRQENIEKKSKSQQTNLPATPFIPSSDEETSPRFQSKQRSYNQPSAGTVNFTEPIYDVNEKEFNSMLSPSAGYETALTQTEITSICSCLYKLDRSKPKSEIRVMTHRRAPLYRDFLSHNLGRPSRSRKVRLGNCAAVKPPRPPAKPFGVAFSRVVRMFFALFSFIYMTLCVAYLAYYGWMCEDNAGSELIQIFAVQLLVWFLFVVPVSGYSVLILEWIFKSFCHLIRLNTY